MPRSRKTSTQPKRKPKKAIIKPKPVYPDYLQNFINEVESKTTLTVHIDQYSDGNSYHVGVNQKVGNVHRCIWMVGFVDSAVYLTRFWESEAFKSYSKA
jgi:hypothetical protein